jgi:hypothetical protein
MKFAFIFPAVFAASFFELASRGLAQGDMYAELGLDGKWQIVGRGEVPTWENDERFKDDVFTFVRVEYSSSRNGRRWDYSAQSVSASDGGLFAQRGRGRRGGGRRSRGGGGWATDYPESDLNFSYRLQQLTSLKVDPNPKVVRLTDPELFDYPFVYMIEPSNGGLYFTEPEITALRRYLMNGGFLMVDDFWGDYAWEDFYYQIKRVFPDREPVELPIEHEIFHIVYNLKEKPQVPSIGSARQGREWGITYETGHGPGAETPHFKGIFDDKGRMMVIICHNTDLGDGWEREGYDEWYFHEFCENKAYPMGINIVTYALTH